MEKDFYQDSVQNEPGERSLMLGCTQNASVLSPRTSRKSKRGFYSYSEAHISHFGEM